MMSWHLERHEDPGGLTDEELIALSHLAAQAGQTIHRTPNVYQRAWTKLQPAVSLAWAAAQGTPPPTVLTPEPIRVEGGL